MATIYRANGAALRYEPRAGNEGFTLAELQGIVGGYIEMVRLWDGRVMVVNEEGLLRGLPFNRDATTLYHLGRVTTDPIVGDVLVCTRREAGYEGDAA